MKTTQTSLRSSITQENRCLCGNLLARVCPEGVELKCRRCKRLVLIPWQAATSWQEVALHSPPQSRQIHSPNSASS